MRIDASRTLEMMRGRQLVPDTCQAVMLVGSVAHGWSNSKSDLDFCVVSTEPWSGPERVAVAVPLEPSVVGWHSFSADNRNWDLAYWLDTHFDQMLAKVSWAEFDQVRAASGDALAPREEILLGRLATCVPLAGKDWLTRRRAELDASAFRSILVIRSLGAMDRAVEDALGQLEHGDLTSAVLSARIALGHIIDALLEEQGQYGSHLPKWRARRFLAAGSVTLPFATYWELETMRDFDADDPAKWIKNVLTLCQDLSSKIEV